MKIPYPLVAAVKVEDRHAQMMEAIAIANARGWPRLDRVPIDDRRTMSIACYGPSLLQTWETLQRPILSMSGATRFLADRGIIPEYHLDMDPRAHKAEHLNPPVPGVHYLMASVCPPRTWELLKDQQVTLWHTFSGTDAQGVDTYNWVAQHDREGELVIHGGSTIGLTALHLGGVLGYRHFEIHGMDGSFQEGARHSGVHFGRVQKPDYTWRAEGHPYVTTQIMANAVAETINTISRFPMFCVFHGEGLTQALVREANVPNACTANQTEKAEKVRRAFVRVVDMPPLDAKRGQSYWDALVDIVPPMMVTELIAVKRQAEPLRTHAKYDTGSVPLETALLLRALCVYYQPKVIAEVGTFIGMSTYALQATKAIHTCDESNHCIVADPSRRIHVHPYTSSTAMFQQMIDAGLEGQVDLFVLDGRLKPADLDLLQRLGHSRSMFALDDCTELAGANKGLANLKLLHPLLPDHAFIPPHPALQGRSTLGALLPLIVPVVP